MPENGRTGIKERVHTFLKRLKGQGAPIWFYKTHGSRYSRAGVVDYLVCIDGKLIGIELKSPEVAPTPSSLQANEIRHMRAAGATAFTSNDFDEVQAYVLGALSLCGWSANARRSR